ncbi:carbamoyl phosphate synthase large subunit [Salinibacillus xinjiangensis]|uniref:Carbamoyl phosphate synthase large chain n=1 Tax=Salinibacillus xinjiangensis TaxID=1229268 RepID=A0A6G1XBI7_9BACI|nr:carbamoyl phosphate synthase large subunit [Salinibacillus xinjiangensis]MRG88266.1 carbamoyl phosphate synthase large subunit [Salinibacillus xinjiangensis]
MLSNHAIQKVLVIGSGPIVIGQAAEFDYAGTQACLALKEEGIEVVLVNNNPATIMTDPHIADHVYLEPLTCESVTHIIEKERPDGLLATLGGQTGLNLALSLTEAGVLNRYNVELLGTPLDSIQKGEDRDKFKSMMVEIEEPIAESISTDSISEAVTFATSSGYPIMIRPAYTLGGAGGGIAKNEEELKGIVKQGIQLSPINQVLIEQSVKGWKEIEFEVMRDANDTCIIICSMENIDPVGVHTGDSMVVAPAQTLTDRQYQMLRTTSCKVIRELGVVGGCNIQFAVDPDSDGYVIIEVNPRVSRSSALASKATGYPIASIAAKLALGFHLDEVINPITGNTYASFEPAIDYVAVKLPRFPFDKFPHADRNLGTQMQATGEVMAIARNIPAGILKAIRSLEIGLDYLYLPTLSTWSDQKLLDELKYATDERIFLLGEALRRGYTVDELHRITEIHTFFLNEISTIIQVEKRYKQKDWKTINPEDWGMVKQLGFSNHTLAEFLGIDEKIVENELKKLTLAPSYKIVDTCAAEFSADTPYYYSSWNEFDEVETLTAPKKTLVIGSGPIRIGQGIEFDYCSVQAALSLKQQGIYSVVMNNNPETVSTDFNTADHLYFEPLTEEDVLHVIEKEYIESVLVQFGGQTAINLAEGLHKKGVKVAGTSIQAINQAEDRDEFYQLLAELNIPHIPGETVSSFEDSTHVGSQLGYPLLIRPSYVIGGQGMAVIENSTKLEQYLRNLQSETTNSKIFPLLMDRFIQGKEVEIDAVCDGEDILIPGIFEHIERAGVHSGDSIAVFPAPSLTTSQKERIKTYTEKISKKLNVQGLMNIQFVISEEHDQVYVLEVNPRASRTVPICSKVTGIPLIDIATKVQMGESLASQHYPLGLHEDIPFYAVKMPIFSTQKLKGVDTFTGPDMKSTGEAIGLGSTVGKAMVKAFQWSENSYQHITARDQIFISTRDVSPTEWQNLCTTLSKLEAKIVATQTTSELLEKEGVTVTEIITMDDAIIRCQKDDFSLIFSNLEHDPKHIKLREQALKTGTHSFTAIETCNAFLNATFEALEKPNSIQHYLNQVKENEQIKESVSK